MMTVMIVAIVLLLIALFALVLEKAYFALQPKELKRRAAQGDYSASALYPAAAYGTSLKLLLFAVAILSAAAGFTIIARSATSWLGYIAIGVLLIFIFVWFSAVQANAIAVRLAIWSAPALAWLLRYTHLVSRHAAPLMSRPTHTGIFDREDMNDLIERQKLQDDSRISHEELDRMRCILYFSDYMVRDIVVPYRQVKAVSADDDLSPVLLNELHETGHSHFPVYEGKATNVVGTLSIHGVADVKQHGRVWDNFDHQLTYLNEDDNLEQALRAFYETRQHLFIVINKHNEYVGIITLSDILYRLFGTMEHYAFGHYDDRKAVAGRYDHPRVATKIEEAEGNILEKSTEVIE